MRRLRYSINTTVDGCGDHRLFLPGPDVHAHAAAQIASADAIILGRRTYELMELGWRTPAPVAPSDMDTSSFHTTINAAKKYLVSSTRSADGWNTERLVGDPRTAVRRLKEEPGGPLTIGGISLPSALAAAGLIDEFEFVVHPLVAAQGPRILDGLGAHLTLRAVGRAEFDGGVVALRYEVVR